MMSRSSVFNSGKKSYSFAFSGTTKPGGITDVALVSGAGTTTVSSGIMREGNSTASNATYDSLAIWGVQMGTTKYESSVVFGSLNTTNRGIGPAMSNATGTKVIYVTTTGNGGTSTITTYISGTRTSRATASINSSSGQTITIRATVSGGIWTYTMYKNGVAQSLSWTDSSSVFGAPGQYPGGIFRHIYLNGQLGSPGIPSYSAKDL